MPQSNATRPARTPAPTNPVKDIPTLPAAAFCPLLLPLLLLAAEEPVAVPPLLPIVKEAPCPAHSLLNVVRTLWPSDTTSAVGSVLTMQLMQVWRLLTFDVEQMQVISVQELMASRADVQPLWHWVGKELGSTVLV